MKVKGRGNSNTTMNGWMVKREQRDDRDRMDFRCLRTSNYFECKRQGERERRENPT